jgi:hypothetical protein
MGLLGGELIITEVGLAGVEADTVEIDRINSARKANMRVNRGI